MGNASSSPSGGTPSQGGAATSNSSAPHSTSSAQPIPTATSSSGPAASTSTATAFHSGLTPPARTPSPPCPSTPPLLPYGGHLSPQNPHALSLTQAHDYSKSVVTRLILEARLAPFYRGLEDYDEDYTEESIGKILHDLKEKDYEEGVANSVVEAMKAERESASTVGTVTKKIKINRAKDSRLEEEKVERDKRERRAYLGALECPICFLNYPSNINTSRCCQQPICTECFVQIKRSEATLTHLESEPACCPFCVETDFGVIYERPILPTPLPSAGLLDSSALSVSPEAGTSAMSRVHGTGDNDAELDVGIGMAPKMQETMRRKSVSHKSKEVVTIDEIRPDWEAKLNAVKAAAARKASRRIVMRQVGDRLVPIGFTSARAPGQADFSMSTGGTESGTATPARGERRRGGSRGRDLEELMIMEAMRLSLLDHDDHQRRQLTEHGETDNTAANTAANAAPPPPQQSQRAPDKRKFSLTVPGQSTSGSSSRRASDASVFQPKHEKSSSTASKIFSKITNSGNRSRSASTASSLRAVSFSPSTTHLGNAGPSRTDPTSAAPPSPQPATPSPPLAGPTSAFAARNPPSALSPTTTAPAITTLTDHTAVQAPSPVPPPTSTMSAAPPAPAPIGLPTPVGDAPAVPGFPRLSLDMEPMAPTPAGAKTNFAHQERAPLVRNDTDVSDAPTERPSYARLDSGND